jgi:hypothetical protein
VLVYVLCSSTMLVVNKVCLFAVWLPVPVVAHARTRFALCAHSCVRLSPSLLPITLSSPPPPPLSRALCARVRACSSYRCAGAGARVSVHSDPPPHLQAAMNA